MLNDTEFESFLTQYPHLRVKGKFSKLMDTLRDQLKPSDTVTFAGPAQVAAGPGLVCLTSDDLHLLWSQKFFFFFKLPVLQTMHRAHLKLELEGDTISLSAGEDENRLTFQSARQASEFFALAGGS